MKKALFLFLALGILGVLVAAGFVGRPTYRRYREHRAVDRAQAALQRGDYRGASLSARQALRINPRNLEACAMMGQLAESAHAPQTLDWRRRLVEIAPTRTNKLLLASTALRFQEPPYPLARETLQGMERDSQELPSFHNLSAELALKLNQYDVAEKHFKAAMLLEPGNELPRLNLAVLQLKSTNDATAAEARHTLESMTNHAGTSALALGWLVEDRLAHRDAMGALRFSSELLQLPNPGFSDRLRHLSILKAARPGELEDSLATLRQKAGTNAANIHGLCGWLISAGRAREALSWITNCPAQVQEAQPVPMARVDCHVALEDWAGLESYLQDRDWEDLDFMRLAFLSETALKRGDSDSAQAQWRLALHAAADRLGALQSLLSMAGHWNRVEAREATLWQLVQKFPREHQSARELESTLTLAGNTRGLQKLYALLVEQDTRNWKAQNNFAATSLLMGMSLPQAHKAACELFTAHPDDPVIVSTYAWSLHLQGKTADALSILNGLTENERQQPPVALYYGLLLVRTGETNKARPFLETAGRSKLLPEERQLIAGATGGA